MRNTKHTPALRMYEALEEVITKCEQFKNNGANANDYRHVQSIAETARAALIEYWEMSPMTYDEAQKQVHEIASRESFLMYETLLIVRDTLREGAGQFSVDTLCDMIDAELKKARGEAA